MMERRSYERRKSRVNEDDVQRWVEEENFERDHGAEMFALGDNDASISMSSTWIGAGRTP